MRPRDTAAATLKGIFQGLFARRAHLVLDPRVLDPRRPV